MLVISKHKDIINVYFENCQRQPYEDLIISGSKGDFESSCILLNIEYEDYLGKFADYLFRNFTRISEDLKKISQEEALKIEKFREERLLVKNIMELFLPYFVHFESSEYLPEAVEYLTDENPYNEYEYFPALIRGSLSKEIGGMIRCYLPVYFIDATEKSFTLITIFSIEAESPAELKEAVIKAKNKADVLYKLNYCNASVFKEWKTFMWDSQKKDFSVSVEILEKQKELLKTRILSIFFPYSLITDSSYNTPTDMPEMKPGDLSTSSFSGFLSDLRFHENIFVKDNDGIMEFYIFAIKPKRMPGFRKNEEICMKNDFKILKTFFIKVKTLDELEDALISARKTLDKFEKKDWEQL